MQLTSRSLGMAATALAVTGLLAGVAFASSDASGTKDTDPTARGADIARLAHGTTLTDKAKIVEHLNKAFAHAKAELVAADPATLTGRRQVMGQSATAIDAALGIGGDLHEHLGQMIAYARMNHIVPPWSK